MTVHYLDPSAWVKRYFQEEGSGAVNALFRAPVAAACCRLGVVEVIATVARKGAQASLEQPVVESILDAVRADFAAFRVVPVDEAVIAAATDLAIRHRLRTIDALHLACALSLETRDGLVIVSADSELLAAAATEGAATLNPAIPGGVTGREGGV